MTALNDYLKENNKELYGVAYGNNKKELDFAKKTLSLVDEQWKDIISYQKKKCIVPFLEDINNWENLINNVENNYY